jgi:hypothetical protein
LGSRYVVRGRGLLRVYGWNYVDFTSLFSSSMSVRMGTDSSCPTLIFSFISCPVKHVFQGMEKEAGHEFFSLIALWIIVSSR